MAIFSDKIFLRALEPDDVDFIYKIENEPEIWDAGVANSPISRFQIANYVASQSQDIFQTGELRLVIMEKESSSPCGLLDLTGISPLDRRAEVGIVIAKSSQGRGLGKAALSLLCEYAYEKLYLRILYAKIYESNQLSRSLFESVKFTKLAVLPQWGYHRGKYENLIVYYRKLG